MDPVTKIMIEYPGITPQCASLVLFLHEKGGFAPHLDIALHLGSDVNGPGDWRKATGLIRVLVNRIRSKAGETVIENVWGRGYLLVPDERMKSVLP